MLTDLFPCTYPASTGSCLTQDAYLEQTCSTRSHKLALVLGHVFSLLIANQCLQEKEHNQCVQGMTGCGT